MMMIHIWKSRETEGVEKRKMEPFVDVANYFEDDEYEH